MSAFHQCSRAALGLVACAFMLACTTPAEHSNPLDPESPLHVKTGALRVQVTTFYPPYQPLAQAHIRLLPANIEVQSNAAGEYIFGELESGEYALSATKDGYDDVQVTAQVTTREMSTAALRLDALPRITSARLSCARIATREATLPRLFLKIEIEAVDADGENDVMHMHAQFPSRAQTDTLARGLGLARWERTFSEAELAPLTMQNLVGQAVQILAEDRAAKKSAPAVLQLARVIEEEPAPFSPSNGEIINPNNVTLRWQTPAINFDHTLSVEMTRFDAGFAVTFATFNNIPAGEVSLPYPGRLATGSYHWTLKVLDRFGNSSRSKEAAFQVR